MDEGASVHTVMQDFAYQQYFYKDSQFHNDGVLIGMV